MKPLSPGRSMPVWLVAWLLLTVTAIVIDPIFVIDETRYAAVAWEMWSRQDLLVPFLNGEPYSHKPPFLFWLFHAGWFLFGVNGWWLRLGPALFGLGALFLSRALASRLWPDRPRVTALAPVILLGTGLWAMVADAVMFDLVLTFWVLLALLGLLEAARKGGMGFWLLTGIAIGLGILTKGPVMLLHVLPAALLAPWWSQAEPPRWGHWYLGVFSAVLIGVAIGLAWAIPAASQGGKAYADAILWGQTAGRVIHSFAHARPWWWYLPWLPLLLLPWTLWPGLWRSLVGLLRDRPLDMGTRFCIAWAVPVFTAFSLVSGKRIHYLLPLVPAFALLAARALARPDLRGIRQSAWPMGIFLVSLAVLLFIQPELVAHYAPQRPIAGLSVWWGLVPLALALLFFRRLAFESLPYILLGTTSALILVLQWGVIRPVAHLFDTRPIGRELARLQAMGRPIAYVGNYHGEYQFAGRLRRPLTVIGPRSIQSWAKENPQGVLVEPYQGRPSITSPPFASWPLRSRTVAFWAAGTLATKDPAD